MKTMKKILNATLLALGGLGVIACNNSDHFQENQPQETDDIMSGYASHIIHELYDTVFTEHGDTTFVLKVGECINSSEPNKYFIVAENATEAALFYNTHCTNNHWVVKYEEVDDSLVLNFDVCNRTTDFGNYGSTTFQLGGEEPAYATITLNLATIGKEQTLVFVPSSFMPNNSDYKRFVSPYKLGDIYKDNNNRQWLCVKASTPSQNGYFIRFGKDGIKRDTYSDCCKKVDYWKFNQGDPLASQDACNDFMGLLGVGQGKDAYDAMCLGTETGVSMKETQKVCAIYYGDDNSSYCFQVGNFWESDEAYCWGDIDYNQIFNAVNMHIGRQYYRYTSTHVRVSSTSTGGDIPMRLKEFGATPFAGWTPIYPKKK